MLWFSLLMAFLAALPRGDADPRGGTRRFKPVIQVTEEIDVNDITFTTSAPGHHEGAGKGGRGRLGDASPGVFPHVSYKDGFGPLEKIHATGQPLLVPVTRRKPYKVFRIQDGVRPVPHKSKSETPAAFAAPEISKSSAKVISFSAQPPPKPPLRTSPFLVQENNNFIPSPTFSPTVLALINNENHQRFAQKPDVGSILIPKTVDWPKPSKTPQHIKPEKKIPENHHQGAGVREEDFAATSERLSQKLSPLPLHKESPQQSESFLSEISTLHKGGGGGADGLDGVPDSLDLKTGERVEFQMYGMDGPQSYKFGFDTGKGHNRHFRFEERDNSGKVKGHYGYLDEDGKMRIMKYEADPITGFHAGPVEISPDDN